MNQNLSKLGKQLLAIWGQLGVSQRISVVAATFVLIAGLATISYWSSRAEYGLLYGGLSDGEASKVSAALDDAKVLYHVSGGGNITVPKEKVYAMRMMLASKGIPQGDGVGFEIFDRQNFGISDFVQRANYTRALQGELARTISQLDEIQSARVMIVLPENKLLLDKDKFATASVFVRVRGNSQLPAPAINSIRFLVANSVEGLKPNHVSVVDNLGNVLSENQDDDSLTGLSTSQLAARRNFELYVARKAQDMLEKVLGPGQAIVRVSAEVNYDTSTKTEDKYDPDGQVIKSQTKTDDNLSSATAANNQATGISANTADTNNVASSGSPVNNTKNTKSVSTVEYNTTHTQISSVQAPGSLKRLTAAITVATQMEGAGAERKAVARTPEDLEKLRRIVSNALGADPTRGDVVALEEMPFNDQFATEMTQQLDQQTKRDYWMNLAHSLMYPALGLVALFILMRAFKSTAVQDIPLGVPVGRLGYKTTATGGNGNPRFGDLFEPQPGVVTVDVLNKLIKDNPNNMTQAIRDWMNRGHTAETPTHDRR